MSICVDDFGSTVASTGLGVSPVSMVLVTAPFSTGGGGGREGRRVSSVVG